MIALGALKPFAAQPSGGIMTVKKDVGAGPCACPGEKFFSADEIA
jgi:hypothetical protein